MANNKSAPGDKFIWIGFIASPLLTFSTPSFLPWLRNDSGPWGTASNIPTLATVALVALGIWMNRRKENFDRAAVTPQRRAKQLRRAFVVFMIGFLGWGLAAFTSPIIPGMPYYMNEAVALQMALISIAFLIAGGFVIWVSLAFLAVALSHPVSDQILDVEAAVAPPAEPEIPTS